MLFRSAAFKKKGGRVFVDGSSTVAIPGSEKIPMVFPFTVPGKPHSWTAPNMVGNETDTIIFERAYPELAKAFSAALGDTGHAWLKSEKGLEAKISLMQIDGGRDAQYIVAINDSWVSNQADWHQVKETLAPLLIPGNKSTQPGFLYDCTDEKAMGTLKSFACDMSKTTARVFANLPRELKNVALSATQSIKAGNKLTIAVEFRDAKGKRLVGVLPFHLTIRRPDGTAQAEFYRSTTREGTFAMALPIAANDPAGKWTIEARSQLTGEMATLPVTVTPAKSITFASTLAEPVVVRQRDAIEYVHQRCYCSIGGIQRQTAASR